MPAENSERPVPPILPPVRRQSRWFDRPSGELVSGEQPALPSDKIYAFAGSTVVSNEVTPGESIVLGDSRLEKGYI